MKDNKFTNCMDFAAWTIQADQILVQEQGSISICLSQQASVGISIGPASYSHLPAKGYGQVTSLCSLSKGFQKSWRNFIKPFLLFLSVIMPLPHDCIYLSFMCSGENTFTYIVSKIFHILELMRQRIKGNAPKKGLTKVACKGYSLERFTQGRACKGYSKEPAKATAKLHGIFFASSFVFTSRLTTPNWSTNYLPSQHFFLQH